MGVSTISNKMAAADGSSQLDGGTISSSEMRAKSSDWNLACDVQLRKRLELTFTKFQQRAQALTESIDEIDAKMTATAGKLGNLNQ